MIFPPSYITFSQVNLVKIGKAEQERTFFKIQRIFCGASKKVRNPQGKDKNGYAHQNLFAETPFTKQILLPEVVPNSASEGCFHIPTKGAHSLMIVYPNSLFTI